MLSCFIVVIHVVDHCQTFDRIQADRATLLPHCWLPHGWHHEVGLIHVFSYHRFMVKYSYPGLYMALTIDQTRFPLNICAMSNSPWNLTSTSCRSLIHIWDIRESSTYTQCRIAIHCNSTCVILVDWKDCCQSLILFRPRVNAAADVFNNTDTATVNKI